MRTRLLIIIVIGFLPLIPLGFSQCIKNEDWEGAPCLDGIGNGWYFQKDVDRWSEYYSYKGSEVMEEKYLELDKAIREDLVEEWTRESHENLNVYKYYFFSGRAPNTGEYSGLFHVISANEEESLEVHKPTYVNWVPLFSYEYGIIKPLLSMVGLAVSVIAVICFMIWRKRK